MIRVQEHDFSVADEYQSLRKPNVTGAIVHFIGTVREFSEDKTGAADASFYLQHYPGMTESVLEKIEHEACQRWDLIHSCIIHRVGQLTVDDQIVFVGASSAHREHAFAACQYMIDILKTEAPFWKKEGDNWVDAKNSDHSRAERWLDSAKVPS